MWLTEVEMCLSLGPPPRMLRYCALTALFKKRSSTRLSRDVDVAISLCEDLMSLGEDVTLSEEVGCV